VQYSTRAFIRQRSAARSTGSLQAESPEHADPEHRGFICSEADIDDRPVMARSPALRCQPSRRNAVRGDDDQPTEFSICQAKFTLPDVFGNELQR
jgi:hypothetical protein